MLQIIIKTLLLTSHVHPNKLFKSKQEFDSIINKKQQKKHTNFPRSIIWIYLPRIVFVTWAQTWGWPCSPVSLSTPPSPSLLPWWSRCIDGRWRSSVYFCITTFSLYWFQPIFTSVDAAVAGLWYKIKYRFTLENSHYVICK